MQKALDDIKSIMSELENMKEISLKDLDLLGEFIIYSFNIYFLTHLKFPS